MRDLGLGHYDNINRMITISVITLSGFHCITINFQFTLNFMFQKTISNLAIIICLVILLLQFISISSQKIVFGICQARILLVVKSDIFVETVLGRIHQLPLGHPPRSRRVRCFGVASRRDLRLLIRSGIRHLVPAICQECESGSIQPLPNWTDIDDVRRGRPDVDVFEG